jgi:hypothetical protein
LPDSCNGHNTNGKLVLIITKKQVVNFVIKHKSLDPMFSKKRSKFYLGFMREVVDGVSFIVHSEKLRINSKKSPIILRVFILSPQKPFE